MEHHLTRSDIQDMDKRFRAQFINSIPGFKSVSLVGTADSAGSHNLAIFNSVIHLGSNPPLLGFITRPTTVPRHTYQNIQEVGHYTINHLHRDLYRAAHQTAARYEEGVSEFEAVGLTAELKAGFPAPFVGESRIKLGLKYVEEHAIANGTILMVGEIQEIWMPTGLIREDGYVDIEQAGSLGVTGIDSYHETRRLARLSYAKPDRAPEEINPSPLQS